MSTDKIALVTGAGSGIGKAVALAFIAAGYTVVLAGRRADRLDAVAPAARPGKALAVPTDVADPDAVAALFQRIRERFGRLDVLFNNAGVFPPALPVEDLAIEQWRAAIDTNLSGMFYCIREAFKLMKAQTPRGGRIINNGSLAAHAPRPNGFAYTASKHGVTGLTKCAALDGRKYDIACGQIDIGNAETSIAAAFKTGVTQADGSVKPEPLMDTEDVARAVLYMAGLPLDANVLFLTVMATKAPFVGRG